VLEHLDEITASFLVIVLACFLAFGIDSEVKSLLTVLVGYLVGNRVYAKIKAKR
jgi:hypothetical protein